MPPTYLDLALALYFCVWVPLFSWLDGRDLARRVAAGVTVDRTVILFHTIRSQVLEAGLLLTWWFSAGRDAGGLGLTLGVSSSRIIDAGGQSFVVQVPTVHYEITLLICLGTAAIVLRGMYEFWRPKALFPWHRRQKLPTGRWILPMDRSELGVWIVVTIVVAICEELAFRGFLSWFAVSTFGAPIGWIVVTLAFGLAHAYQGLRGVIYTTFLGAILAGFYVWTGMLWPAIFAHAGFNVFAALRILAIDKANRTDSANTPNSAENAADSGSANTPAAPPSPADRG